MDLQQMGSPRRVSGGAAECVAAGVLSLEGVSFSFSFLALASERDVEDHDS